MHCRWVGMDVETFFFLLFNPLFLGSGSESETSILSMTTFRISMWKGKETKKKRLELTPSRVLVLINPPIPHYPPYPAQEVTRVLWMKVLDRPAATWSSGTFSYKEDKI